MDVVQDQGNEHKIIITLSNLFTTPLATGVPFSYEDMTPVAMLALDNFVLWVNADTDVQDRHRIYRGGEGGRPQPVPDGRHRLQVRRTRSSRWRSSRRPAPSSPTCRSRAAATSPWRSSAATSTPRSTTRSSRSRTGRAAPPVRSAFSPPSACRSKATLPGATSRPARKPASTMQYQMLRGIFMPAGVDQEVVDYYVDLFQKVRETPEWKEFMAERRLHPDLHDRRRIQGLGGGSRRAAQGPDDRSGLPRRQVTT